MRVLVTGAAGFIGGHVTTALRSAGHDVIELDCMHPAAHATQRRPDTDLIIGDVRDAEVVRAALSGVEAVCHQAAMVGMGVDLNDAPEYASCNDVGTAVLLAEMARARVHRLVLAGSMVVYGEGAYSCAAHGRVCAPARAASDLVRGRFEPCCPQCGSILDCELIDESARLEPRSVYAATKLAQESLAGAWARATAGAAISLRYHNVYGPHMPRDTPYSGVAAIFRSCLENGRPPKVFEDGGQLRDFVHVKDVASANVLALEGDTHAPGSFTPYNIASGEPHTVLDMATALAEAMSGPAPEVTGAFRPGDVRHIVASPRRAQDELGFKARVPFAEGVAEFAKAPLRQ